MQELGDVAAARQEFERWLERQPLAGRTKSEYQRNVRVFLDWLLAAGMAAWDADPLSDRLAPDYAARDSAAGAATSRTRSGKNSTT
jgi:hypothetical protein